MAATLEQRLSDLEARVTKLEGLEIDEARREKAGESTLKQKKLAAKEFLMTRTIKSEREKTLALAYYLEYKEGLSSFNINDLAGAFEAAKEKRPKNLSDMVGKNIAQGFLMEASQKREGKKAWTLTATGERYIEESAKS